jgi:hypothetical protein
LPVAFRIPPSSSSSSLSSIPSQKPSAISVATPFCNNSIKLPDIQQGDKNRKRRGGEQGAERRLGAMDGFLIAK